MMLISAIVAHAATDPKGALIVLLIALAFVLALTVIFKAVRAVPREGFDPVNSPLNK